MGPMHRRQLYQRAVPCADGINMAAFIVVENKCKKFVISKQDYRSSVKENKYHTPNK